VPRAAAWLFARAHRRRRLATCLVRVAFFKIYCEKVYDLLSPAREERKVRESPEKVVYVEGLVECVATHANEVLELLAKGNRVRSTAATNMNAHSSRSHCMLVLTVEQRHLKSNRTLIGKLHLVDLAGSESLARTGNTGTRMAEGKDINQSLSTLARVVQALSEHRSHVPFRESELTRILQGSLGGNCLTTLLVAVSPLDVNGAETVASLRFAATAKKVVSTVKKNERQDIAGIKTELEALRASNEELEGAVHSLSVSFCETYGPQ